MKGQQRSNNKKIDTTKQTYNNWRLELNLDRWLSKTTQLSDLFRLFKFSTKGLFSEAALRKKQRDNEMHHQIHVCEFYSTDISAEIRYLWIWI